MKLAFAIAFLAIGLLACGSARSAGEATSSRWQRVEFADFGWGAANGDTLRNVQTGDCVLVVKWGYGVAAVAVSRAACR